MPRSLRRPARFLARVQSYVASRFGDERARFRLAVSTGFFLTAVSFLVVGADTRFGSAQSILGLLGLPESPFEAPRPFDGQAPARAAHPRQHHARTVRPDAFAYTIYVDEACACLPAGGGGGGRSLLRDFTLRRGDAVMTEMGLQVFHAAPAIRSSAVPSSR